MATYESGQQWQAGAEGQEAAQEWQAGAEWQEGQDWQAAGGQAYGAGAEWQEGQDWQAAGGQADYGDAAQYAPPQVAGAYGPTQDAAAYAPTPDVAAYAPPQEPAATGASLTAPTRGMPQEQQQPQRQPDEGVMDSAMEATQQQTGSTTQAAEQRGKSLVPVPCLLICIAMLTFGCAWPLTWIQKTGKIFEYRVNLFEVEIIKRDDVPPEAASVPKELQHFKKDVWTFKELESGICASGTDDPLNSKTFYTMACTMWKIIASRSFYIEVLGCISIALLLLAFGLHIQFYKAASITVMHVTIAVEAVCPAVVLLALIIYLLGSQEFSQLWPPKGEMKVGNGIYAWGIALLATCVPPALSLVFMDASEATPKGIVDLPPRQAADADSGGAAQASSWDDQPQPPWGQPGYEDVAAASSYAEQQQLQQQGQPVDGWNVETQAVTAAAAGAEAQADGQWNVEQSTATATSPGDWPQQQ